MTSGHVVEIRGVVSHYSGRWPDPLDDSSQLARAGNPWSQIPCNNTTVKVFRFHELRECPLVVDAIYEGGVTKNIASEVISKILSANGDDGKPVSVGNAGGFRFRGRLPSPLVVALVSDASEAAWPDKIDPFTGQLTYFGDNRGSGELHGTPRGGNRILAEAFSTFDTSSAARETLPIFLYFSKWKGFSQQFRGLVVPGGVGLSSDDHLTAIWRTKDGHRFQNYRAVFTVLDIPEISRAWLEDLLLGRDRMVNAPDAYQKWVRTGRYSPLVSENVAQVRTKEEQLPHDSLGIKLVTHLQRRFSGTKAYLFEPVALALWGMLSKIPMDAQVTQRSVDGGRDAYGAIRIGPLGDPLRLDFALEAKCYAFSNSVGVKETSRLISRLRRHHFGVIVTTSYVGKQAYSELREDAHPVVLITAVDIARLLQENGYDDIEKLDRWLDSLMS